MSDAYATVDDLKLSLPDSPGAGQDDYLLDLLVRASAVIDTRCGRQFSKSPSSGTTTRLIDGDGSSRLVIPDGIVSIASLSIAAGTGQDLLVQDPADWFLAPAYPEAGDTYYSVQLSDVLTASTFYRFPAGHRNVQVVGVFGYATVPEIIRNGALALAREMYSLQPTGRGSMASAAGFGSVPTPDLLPRATYDAIQWGSSRTRWLYT